MHDFERFFAGLTVDVRGTTAGLDEYPLNPYAHGALRERFGELAYELFVQVDDMLFERDEDLFAKHWAIAARPGPPGLSRRVPSGAAPLTERAELIRGAYDAAYSDYEGPSSLPAGSVALASVKVLNRSWRVWQSEAEPPVLLSYRWCRAQGEVVAEGPRTALLRPLGPDQQLNAALQIAAPAEAGSYVIAIDLVEEGVTWSSAAGSVPLRIAVRVT